MFGVFSDSSDGWSEIVEGTFSIKAFVYYFKNRKELKNKKNVARSLLTRNRFISPSNNIIKAVDTCLFNTNVTRNKETVSKEDPLFVLQKGDIVYISFSWFVDAWEYTGEKLIYREDLCLEG